MPDKEKSKYAADTLAGMKIFKGTEAYKGGKNAPILLMGDSFTGVFESVDQKSGGPGRCWPMQRASMCRCLLAGVAAPACITA